MSNPLPVEDLGEFTQEQTWQFAAEQAIQSLSRANHLLDSLSESALQSLSLDQRSRLFSSVMHASSIGHRLKTLLRENPDYLRGGK